MLRTWDTAIKNGLFAYYHREEYAYFYGAKGGLLTDAYMDYLIKTYPNHFIKYTPEELKRIKDYSRGKIGYDCSGFTGWICTGDTQNSAGQFANCNHVSTDLVAGVAGSLLYRPGHIGIDIGYGYFLHMPNEGRTIELGKILEYPWEKTGRCNLLDYNGSDKR